MKSTITIILSLISLFNIQAQNIVSGTIFGKDGKPISDANVYIEGSYDGVNSDSLGKFQFETTTQGTQNLIVSLISYETIKKQIDVTNFSNQRIVLLEDVKLMSTVTITAGTFEAGEKSRNSVLTPLDIVTTAGNPGDIVSALQTLPGTQTAGESGRLLVRGGDDNETQTYIDGIRVAQPYLQTANNVPTRSRFSPFLFKGTTFSTGGYSAEYGEALSSVLLLNTIDDPAQSETNLAFMTVGLGLSHVEKGKKNSLSINTAHINLAPYNAIFPSRIDWKNPYSSFGGEAVYRYHIGDGLVKFYTSYDRATFDMNQENINFTDKIRIQNKNVNFYNNITYKGGIGRDGILTIGSSYGSNSNDGILVNSNFDNNEKAVHLKAKLNYNLANNLKTLIGADYFYTGFAFF
jgi:hypothetical protein